ncbi:hypothetical protein [Mobiluncus mulieris]|uniref:Uncharacterized protein n=1 Tax=Mobiluncus mulieris TaxID=2052 RepID=A0A7Y0UTT0_9ACTO|nr:hypothetical protein [Mobiluncus mulieris]NMX03591.1 hypothetical protein [Mobiluncus mulieris]NMX10485.1 hypothetical protein [Mobiluncus mulieris]
MASHGLKLSIAKHIPANPGIVATKTVKVRERIARFLFGAPRKMMIIVPGDSVDQIDIREKPGPNDSLMALAEAVGVAKGGEAK